MLSILHHYWLIIYLNIFASIRKSMKLFFSVAIFISVSSTSLAQSFKVTLQTPSYNNGLAYLTYYYGKNINIEDSAIISEKGIAVFEKKRKTPARVGLGR